MILCNFATVILYLIDQENAKTHYYLRFAFLIACVMGATMFILIFAAIPATSILSELSG